MKYNVTVTNEEGEVIAMSEEPVEMKYLGGEGKCVGREAWEILVARMHKGKKV